MIWLYIAIVMYYSYHTNTYKLSTSLFLNMCPFSAIPRRFFSSHNLSEDWAGMKQEDVNHIEEPNEQQNDLLRVKQWLDSTG